jgi:hypothetical protein
MTKKCQNCGHGLMDHYVGKGSHANSHNKRLGRCRKEFVICKHCNNTGIVRRLEHFKRGLTSLTATIRYVCEPCMGWTGPKNWTKCKCKKFVPFDTIADLKRRVEILT